MNKETRRKKIRKLKIIFSQYHKACWEDFSQYIKRMTPIKNMIDELKLSIEEASNIYNEYKKGHIQIDYTKMPKRERKDNKNFLNFGRKYSQRGWLRFPKKCRKTAWKRFYKLFPEEKNITRV
jgi:hypothetical protein